MVRSYKDDVIRLAAKVNDEATLRRVYKILDRAYSVQPKPEG